ncbi:hypothetical protein BH09PAT4_BH09PAT4_07860 [soil metagenome]
MAGSTAEILTPDGNADEERGIEVAELYANSYTADGQLRTTETEVDTGQLQPAPAEGGKTLYGTFDKEIRFAAGLSIKGAMRGRDIIKYRRGVNSALGRQMMLRVFPGGR